jgi:hypothetical protein
MYGGIFMQMRSLAICHFFVGWNSEVVLCYLFAATDAVLSSMMLSCRG